jgi:hypothetical protein
MQIFFLPSTMSNITLKKPPEHIEVKQAEHFSKLVQALVIWYLITSKPLNLDDRYWSKMDVKTQNYPALSVVLSEAAAFGRLVLRSMCGAKTGVKLNAVRIGIHGGVCGGNMMNWSLSAGCCCS